MGGSYLPLSGTLAVVLPELLCPFLSLSQFSVSMQISQLQQPSVYWEVRGEVWQSQRRGNHHKGQVFYDLPKEKVVDEQNYFSATMRTHALYYNSYIYL